MTAPLPPEQVFVLVVALDLTDTASGGYALNHALRIARRLPNSQLHVVHIESSTGLRQTLGLLRHYVEASALAVGGCERQMIAVHVRKGDVATEISQLASDLAADLIIVGTHERPQLKKLFVGSTAARVMATATCPVVVAGPRPKVEPSHVITIEAACPDCVSTRYASRGARWWCARHAQEHPVLHHHHVYSYHSELPFGDHDY